MIAGEFLATSECVQSHYHALAGMHGCLPNYSATHASYDGAVDDLAFLHCLGRDRRRDGSIELSSLKDGNEYAQVIECTEPECEKGEMLS